MIRPRYRDELRATLDSMLEGVLVVDCAERVLQMNDAARRLLRIRDVVKGRRLKRVTDREEVRAAVARVLAGGAPETAQMRRRDGPRDEVIEVRTTPLKGKRGALTGAIVVLHDASELDRLARVRQEFIANVSHELKTPTTAILAMADTLVDTPDLDPATHDRFLERIRDQAQRMRAVVADLLTLSRLESPDAALAPEVLDLTEPVRDACEALAPVAAAKGVAFGVRFPDRPVRVEADREHLRQAASNLIDNAIKYTPAGGRADVAVGASRKRGWLEVRDTGIGIALDDQERIFERFFRVDRARSRDAGGTGLGLAIVKHVARASGGRVDVTSAPGRGSTFRVSWPLRG